MFKKFMLNWNGTDFVQPTLTSPFFPPYPFFHDPFTQRNGNQLKKFVML